MDEFRECDHCFETESDGKMVGVEFVCFLCIEEEEYQEDYDNMLREEALRNE